MENPNVGQRPTENNFMRKKPADPATEDFVEAFVSLAFENLPFLFKYAK